MNYEYLPHTADLKFRAFGRDIDDVFKNCALAMFNFLGQTSKVKLKKLRKINIKSKSYEQLLYDFLEELLFLFETENLFLHSIKNLEISGEFSLTCDVEGDDSSNYELQNDIKAITYSEMKIRKTNKGYEAVVVLDI